MDLEPKRDPRKGLYKVNTISLNYLANLFLETTATTAATAANTT